MLCVFVASDFSAFHIVISEIEDLKTKQCYIICYCIRRSFRCCCYFSWNLWRGVNGLICSRKGIDGSLEHTEWRLSVGI